MITPSPLTAKQQAVYLTVVQYYAATGEPCSLSYLVRRLKRDRKTILEHLDGIVRKGWVTASTPAFRRVLEYKSRSG